VSKRPRTDAGRQLVHDLTDEGPIVQDFVLAIEREAVTLALTKLRREVEERMAETQKWIDAHPTNQDALNVVNRAAIAAFHETLFLIDKAVPR
jgi:hypothetical protein